MCYIKIGPLWAEKEFVIAIYSYCVMREKGERVCVLGDGRKGGGCISIQAETVYSPQLNSKIWFTQSTFVTLFRKEQFTFWPSWQMKLERKLDITTDWSAMKFITATFMHIQLDLGLIVSLRNCPKIKSTLQSLRLKNAKNCVKNVAFRFL